MYRTEIPTTEKFLGAIILLLLAAVGATVFYKGQHYDPGTYALDPAALDSTRDAVLGVASTMAGESESIEIAQSQSSGQAKQLPSYLDALKPMSPTEHYTPDTLFEKINGRAPAYFEFNFQALTARSFSLKENAAQFIDVFVFRMDSPLNAFGIFSLERDPSGRPIDFAPDGYRSEMGYFFRTGSAYVQVIASSDKSAVMDTAEAYARALAADLPADNSGMETAMKLPSGGQVPGSLTYIQNNAYGQASLKNVFQANYLFEGTELTYFSMRAPSEEAADTTWQSLQSFYRQYGELEGPYLRGDAQVFEAVNFGQTSILARRGNQLSGVMNADDAKTAARFLEAVLTDSLPHSGPAPLPDPQPVEEDYGYE